MVHSTSPCYLFDKLQRIQSRKYELKYYFSLLNLICRCVEVVTAGSSPSEHLVQQGPLVESQQVQNYWFSAVDTLREEEIVEITRKLVRTPCWNFSNQKKIKFHFRIEYFEIVHKTLKFSCWCIQKYYLVIYIILFQCFPSTFYPPADLWWSSYLAIYTITWKLHILVKKAWDKNIHCFIFGI